MIDSRSETPNNMVNRKSPTTDMGVQTNQQNNLGNANKEKMHNKPANQRQNQAPHHNQQGNQNNQMQRESRDSGKQGETHPQGDQNNRFRVS